MRVAGWTLIAALLLVPAAARADIYKCVGDDGTTTFSQTPCDSNLEAAKKDRAPAGAGIDCAPAYRLALETAGHMQRGASSTDAFDRYGGLAALPRGTLNLVNFIYGYRASETMSAERIAGLARSMCESGSLREISCPELPRRFTDALGGCTEEGALAAGVAASPLPPAEPPNPVPSPQPALFGSGTTDAADEAAATERCRQQYQDQIERLDDQMREGYSSVQGDALRERRRLLREQMRRC